MPAAVLPADEADRLAALSATGLLRRRVDPRVRTVTGLAASLLGRPIAAFSLVEARRSLFRPAVGLPVDSIGREVSFCAHAILHPDTPLIVEDTLRDARFADNPLVTGEAGVRCYAGMPVRAAGGQPLGTLCVLDGKPGSVSEAQIAILQRLAGEIEDVIRQERPVRQERQTLLQELRRSVLARKLGVHWQPIAAADTLRVSGYEALGRWNRADGSAVSPDVFIPMAEASGLVGRIDSLVLQVACAAAASSRQPCHVSVNVSASWFCQAQPRLARLLASTLLLTGLAPDRLTIEITERLLIADFRRTLWEIRELKALGVGVVLDDFGTGYSSLSYLEAFPFDMVKLDKAFVRGLGSNPRAEIVARAVMRLCHDLGMLTCAEGVEEHRQLDFLRREGCDLVQGYLIGRPGPAEL